MYKKALQSHFFPDEVNPRLTKLPKLTAVTQLLHYLRYLEVFSFP
jgi:hypothetical protein